MILLNFQKLRKDSSPKVKPNLITIRANFLQDKLQKNVRLWGLGN